MSNKQFTVAFNPDEIEKINEVADRVPYTRSLKFAQRVRIALMEWKNIKEAEIMKKDWKVDPATKKYINPVDGTLHNAPESFSRLQNEPATRINFLKFGFVTTLS